MGAKRFVDLRAWKLGYGLKCRIYDIASRPAVARDGKFCDQIVASSSSVPSNLAEGFGRYTHKDFARFVVIARSSLLETQNHLIDGKDRRHIQQGEFDELWALSDETLGAVTRLLSYLNGGDSPVRRRG
jgi:four helix bundle protein